MTDLARAEGNAIRWHRVNSEPFEYAIQQGPFGDAFVRLLNGENLRRRAPQSGMRAEEIREACVGLVESCHDFRVTSSMADPDATPESLNVFLKSAYPVSREINPRGWNWCEAYLDQAKELGEAALSPVPPPDGAAEAIPRVTNNDKGEIPKP